MIYVIWDKDNHENENCAVARRGSFALEGNLYFFCCAENNSWSDIVTHFSFIFLAHFVAESEILPWLQIREEITLLRRIAFRSNNIFINLCLLYSNIFRDAINQMSTFVTFIGAKNDLIWMAAKSFCFVLVFDVNKFVPRRVNVLWLTSSIQTSADAKRDL